MSRLGVVLTDSHCNPLRRGTVGIAIGFYGFEPLEDYRGRSDLFGRPLGVTVSNRPDAMAAAPVGLMGEGAECVPAVVLRDWPGLTFNDEAGTDGFFLSPEEDIYAPLLEGFQRHGRTRQLDRDR